MRQDGDIRHVPYWGRTQTLRTTVKQVLNWMTWPPEFMHLCFSIMQHWSVFMLVPEGECGMSNSKTVSGHNWDLNWKEKVYFYVTYLNLKYSLITNTICVIWKIVPPHHTSANCHTKSSTTRILKLQTRTMKSCCYCSDSISRSHTVFALS